MVRVRHKRVGDIHLNPFWGDLWILRKQHIEEYHKEKWVLALINDDWYEELEVVEGVIRIGNIYDMVEKQLEEDAK